MAGDRRLLVAVLAAVSTAVGAVVPAGALAAPDQPNWQYFPNIPHLDGSDPDRRVVGCFPGGAVPAGPCDVDERDAPASGSVPWDTGSPTPTATTSGPNADAALSALSPLTPGPDRLVKPMSVTRDYFAPWTNSWRSGRCNPAVFAGPTPGSGGTDANDVNAAIINLFSGLNRMHDWSEALGFTPAAFNMEGGDPMLGDAQAGPKAGAPTFAGRDAGEPRRRPPDGHVADAAPPTSGSPIASAYYPQCVDGAFDMSVVAHEYAHAIVEPHGAAGPRPASPAAPTARRARSARGSPTLLAVELPARARLRAGRRRGPVRRRRLRQRATARAGCATTPMAAQPAQLLGRRRAGTAAGPASPHDDGEIWAAVNYDIRRHGVSTADVDARGRPDRRWIAARLRRPAARARRAATMVQARDALPGRRRGRSAAPARTSSGRAFARRGLGRAAPRAAAPTTPNPRAELRRHRCAPTRPRSRSRPRRRTPAGRRSRPSSSSATTRPASTPGGRHRPGHRARRRRELLPGPATGSSRAPPAAARSEFEREIPASSSVASGRPDGSEPRVGDERSRGLRRRREPQSRT